MFCYHICINDGMTENVYSHDFAICWLPSQETSGNQALNTCWIEIFVYASILLINPKTTTTYNNHIHIM